MASRSCQVATAGFSASRASRLSRSTSVIALTASATSVGGGPKHPRWYYNLKRNPHVELQDGTETGVYVAREVTGEEKALWWERSVAAYPDYADYQLRTDRQIPVFVLDPTT